jgi:hypothetical protein
MGGRRRRRTVTKTSLTVRERGPAERNMITTDKIEEQGVNRKGLTEKETGAEDPSQLDHLALHPVCWTLRLGVLKAQER